MICTDKYGNATEEFSKYAKPMFDKIRELSESFTEKAIEEGVCPLALERYLFFAVEMGRIMKSSRMCLEERKKEIGVEKTL